MNFFSKITKKIKNKTKFLIKKILFRYEKFVPSSLLNASNLNLGGTYSCDIQFPAANIVNSDIHLDITNSPYKWMYSKYQFIWSERMLEHIPFSKISNALQNIDNLLSKNGRCRMCLPICFYGNQKGDMVRKGNAKNCEDYGHITWFTSEELGPVTPECFDSNKPPISISMSWNEILKGTSLKYFPIRHFNADNSLYVNNEIFSQKDCCFLDITEIKIKRPNSIIFDLIKTN